MRIRFDFGSLTLDAELLDTPTAEAIAAALPLTSSVMTWGEEVYFEIPVRCGARARCARGGDAGRDRLLAGRPCIAIGFGRTPIVQGRRDAARQPVQRLCPGGGGREGAWQGEGGDEGDGEHGRVGLLRLRQALLSGLLRDPCRRVVSSATAQQISRTGICMRYNREASGTTMASDKKTKTEAAPKAVAEDRDRASEKSRERMPPRPPRKSRPPMLPKPTPPKRRASAGKRQSNGCVRRLQPRRRPEGGDAGL